MKRLILIIYLFAFVPTALLAQNEASYWYFGENSGIRFNADGSVSPISDGKVNTFEGCATISDAFGELLFYTDGVTVYNKNHDIVLNGNRLNGNPSSTQSAIIVPKPDDDKLYYIFTVDTSLGQSDMHTGLNYSVLDLSADGGQGAITSKNINLLADSSEKVAAVLNDCNDKSVWVVTFANETGFTGPFNAFHAFKVSPAGVETTAIKSIFEDIPISDKRGYLKISPDGTKLASANYSNGLYLYDFNAETGVVSNPLKIEIHGTNQNNSPYGIEFSQNQQFLYVHAHNGRAIDELTNQSSSLIQFDLTAADIESSQVELDVNPIFRGALQIGPNGKIYRTISTNYYNGLPYLGVIHNPNEKGFDANYEHNAIRLEKNATQGLPPFVQSFFDNTAIATSDDGKETSNLVLCVGEPLTLQIQDEIGATYVWKKDGTVLTNTSSTLYIGSLQSRDSGFYSVEATYPSEDCPVIGSTSVFVSGLPAATTLNLTQCDTDSLNDGFTTFNLEEIVNSENTALFFYEDLADFMADTPILNPKAYKNTSAGSQSLYYKLINEYGCENSGDLLLQVQPVVISNPPDDIFHQCGTQGDSGALEANFDLETIRQYSFPNIAVTFYSNLDDVSNEENPLSDEFLSESTIIYARVESDGQCLDVVSIGLNVLEPSDFDFPETHVLCIDNPSLKLQGPEGFDIYKWSTLQEGTITQFSSEKTISIDTIGEYQIEAGYLYSFNGFPVECTLTKTFKVIPSNKATIQEIRVNDISDNNTIEVLVEGQGEYLYAIDGSSYQSSSRFENVPPGFVNIQILDTNGCGIVNEEIAVIGYPKFFTPNGDGQNDTWRIFGANDKFQPNAIISIFDRYGKLLRKFSAATESWDGNHLGNPLPASDYWFSMNLEDGRTFKGHFTLKR